MMTFNEAKVLFNKARDKANGYRLPGRLGQTRLVELCGGGYGIKYVNTIVVSILPNNTYILNTGGYRTRTTKERINQYSPVRLYQHKLVWYLADGKEYGQGAEYSDGIVLNAKGKVIKAPNASQVKKISAMHAKVSKYIDKYMHAIKAGTLPMPSGGDCWGCCMRDANGNTLMGTNHLLEHIRESYLVPSLLVNAIKENGYNPAFVNPWNGLGNNTDTFKRALKAYLRRALCR